jgi:hypothetical protein
MYLIISGTSVAYIGTVSQPIIVKFDPSGNILWSKRLSATVYSFFAAGGKTFFKFNQSSQMNTIHENSFAFMCSGNSATAVDNFIFNIPKSGISNGSYSIGTMGATLTVSDAGFSWSNATLPAGTTSVPDYTNYPTTSLSRTVETWSDTTTVLNKLSL